MELAEIITVHLVDYNHKTNEATRIRHAPVNNLLAALSVIMRASHSASITREVKILADHDQSWAS
jgi:hypothetical protein